MKILIRKDGKIFRELDFVQEVYTVGRSKEADIQLLNEDVSRLHVKISRQDGRIYVQDLKSKNGTVVNGKLVRQAEIEPGQKFEIGPFNIVIENVLPSEQRTVVEHDLTEMETREFRIDRSRAGQTFHSITMIEPKENIKPEVSDPFVEEEYPESDPSISVSMDEAFEEEIEEEPEDPSTQHSVVAPPPLPPTKTPAGKIGQIKIIKQEVKQPRKQVAPEPKESKPLQKNIKTEVYRPYKEEDEDDDFMNAISVDREKSISAKPPYYEEVENSDSVSEVEFDSDSFSEVEEPKTIPAIEKEQAKKLRNTKPLNPFEQDELEEDESDEDEKDDDQMQDQFPSASEEDSVSEQFFLNREIDEGVGETFEDFPKTNKIKVVDNIDYNLSDQVEGSVEGQISTDPSVLEPEKTALDYDNEDSHAGSDAVMTESYKEGTAIDSPDEDEIKTFAFDEDEMPPSKLFDKTDEFRRKTSAKIKNMVQKIPDLRPGVVGFVKKPKNRKVLFFASAVILGLGLYFMMEGEGLFHRDPVNPETAVKSEQGFNKLRKSEKKRVIAYQIDKIQKLINDRQIADADDRMRTLVTLASNDEDFVKFEKKYQQQRELLIEEENKKQKEKQEKEKTKAKLMADGDDMLNKKQFAQAKKSFTKVLDLFPDDAGAQEKLQTVDLLQEQEDRKTFAKKQRYDMLEQIYTEAVQKYESGQPGVAQKLFSQVASEKAHPRNKKALEYLSKIENVTDKKVDDRVAKARDMIQKPATLLQGYNELKKLTAQFPLRSDARKYLADGKTKMEKKARELYADALAQEELAGDPAAALDLYKEVLKYAPDTSNKYYIKAKQKIDNLQL